MGAVIGIIGSSGSGKTTLICRLIERLPSLAISVIKRTHHIVPGFSGGKDTDRYLEAGAEEALLVTPVAIHQWRDGAHSEVPLVEIEDLVARASRSANLVIIESAKYDGRWPRLLVHDARIELPDPLPPHLEAIITNQTDPLIENLPQFDRDQIDEIMQFMIRITA